MNGMIKGYTHEKENINRIVHYFTGIDAVLRIISNGTMHQT